VMTFDEMRKANEVNSTELLCRAIDEHCRRDGQMLFWTCPNGCRGRVEWRMVNDVHVARCIVCGRDSIEVERHNTEVRGDE